MDLLLLAKEGETYKSSPPKEKPKSIQERSKPTSYILSKIIINHNKQKKELFGWRSETN